jgi:predicted transcriptional regulator
MRDYTRLCADAESGVHNRISAATMIREQVGYSPRAQDILEILADVPYPVSALYLAQAMGINPYSSTVATQLWQLHTFGLVTRTGANIHPGGGKKWLYQLSGLGRMVIAKDESDAD